MYSVARVIIRGRAGDDGKRTSAQVDGVVRVCQVVSYGKDGRGCEVRIIGGVGGVDGWGRNGRGDGRTFAIGSGRRAPL